MKYKRVLLVSPRFSKGRNRLSLRPLAGLGYIAESLKTIGCSVKVMDLNLGYSFKELKKVILLFKPDLVGFTVMTFGHREVYDTINKIKISWPSLKVVSGGPHISAVREKTLKDCAGLDYAVILEGEASMRQLCLGQSLDKIEGLIYRDSGRIIFNKFERFNEDLDNFQFPEYAAFELDKYPTKQVGIVTSRGCPYDCIYCSVVASIGKKFRVRSVENVVREIEYWYTRGYREIYILDDNFTLLRPRVEAICALLGQKRFSGLHLKCPNGIRADRVDKTLLGLMRQAGFDMVAFGVEASTDKILKNIKKGESLLAIERSVKDACDLGFDVDLFFLIGSPDETVEDVKKSFAFAQRYPVRRAIFYNLIPMPSTELLQWLKSNSYLIYSEDDIFNNASYYANEPCFFTPQMSIAQRKACWNMGQKISLKIRRRHIERRIKAPAIVKSIFSAFYTLPFVDDAINNNPLVTRCKDKIKDIFLK